MCRQAAQVDPQKPFLIGEFGSRPFSGSRFG